MDVATAQQPAGKSATLTITNQVSELVRVLAWLEQQGKRWQFSGRNLFQLDLVLNEALPNIIDYAYVDNNSHTIAISLTDKNNVIVLEIVDDGTAFNPFALGDYKPALTLEDAAINGRGIHLIKSITDVQEYQRIGQTNVMRVGILKTATNSHPRQAQHNG